MSLEDRGLHVVALVEAISKANALGAGAGLRAFLLADVDVRQDLLEPNGNLSAAARKLGIARSTLYRMLRKHS